MVQNLAPLRIGPIELDVPIVLAAMAGYTDLPYRLICRRLGAPYCYSEMMLDRQLLLPGKLRRRLVRTDPEDHPVAGQIIGNDPSVMARAAGELCRCGFDVVDINLACPVRKVLARRRGGYLLRKPDLALEIIRAVAAAADRPVTVKIRIGFDHPDRASGNFWRIAEGAFDAGVAALCVHARTVVQRYKGKADWDFLAAVKRHFGRRTIIGSGDADDPAAAVEMLRRTGVDGVAFARAALGNPWVFRQFRDYLAGRPLYRPALAEQRGLLEKHFTEMLAIHGPQRGPKMMRKYGIKYARLHPAPARLRAAFVAVRSGSDWQAVLEKFYVSADDDECKEPSTRESEHAR
jgi:nifR3 family TIM-barrel protein